MEVECDMISLEKFKSAEDIKGLLLRLLENHSNNAITINITDNMLVFAKLISPLIESHSSSNCLHLWQALFSK